MGAVLLFLLTSCPPVFAQCPDGTPPPCAARPRATPAIDSNRIAVLPFRVTTADTLLGEGFAELLATEFTGEGGPRAVDMATTLAAWRRVGGGLRTPLSLEAARRLARALGAGQVSQGSIVGLGSRITVTASLVGATDGSPLATSRVSGSVDSIDGLLERVATELLAAIGGRARTAEAARFTNSSVALRAYLEGLSLWRRGRWTEASRAFERSVAADSNFAQAVYQRWFLGAALLGAGVWHERVLRLKDRLGMRERAIIDAVGGPEGRTHAEVLADRRRAVERFPDSPEAWFFYAEHYYHNGLMLVSPDSVLVQARAGFSRAAALDSQPVFLFHLMEIALRTRDTTLLRRLVNAYDRTAGEERWPRGWVAAAVIGDRQLLAGLRRAAPAPPGRLGVLAYATALGNPVPAQLLDEGFRRLEAVAERERREQLRTFAWLVHYAHGRPGSAARAAAGRPVDVLAIPALTWAWVTGDPASDATVLRWAAPTPRNDTMQQRRLACSWARIHAMRAQPDSIDLGTLPQRAGQRCARVVEVWVAWLRGSVTDAQFADLDQLVRLSRYNTFLGVEHRLLAMIHESRGEASRALEAIRLYPRDYVGAWLAPTLREEGRLALAAGDTSGARRAYRTYQEIFAEAEPPFTAERDSVRAIVARLERR